MQMLGQMLGQMFDQLKRWGTELRNDLRLERFDRRQVQLLGLLNAVIVALLGLTLLSAWVPTGDGRVSLLQIWQQELHQPHQQVERLGNIEAMPVRFEGANLFTIASPTVWDRSDRSKQSLPVEVRAKQVEANLNRVVEGGFLQSAKNGILTNFDPQTLQVAVVSLNDVPVIVASDSYHSQPLKLVTVTYIDADYNAQPAAELAEQWRSLIYQNLYAALLERSPDALSLRGKLGESLLAIAVMLGASLVIRLLQMPLYRRNRYLRMQQTALTAERLADAAPISALNQVHSERANQAAHQAAHQAAQMMAFRSQFVGRFEQQQALQQQRQVVGFFRWLLAWSQVAIWLAGLALALGLFPWTRPALPRLGAPVTLLLIWFAVGLSSRLLGWLLQGMAHAWIKFGSSSDMPQRDQLRVFTILSALQPFKSFAVYAAGLVLALVYLGLPLSLVLCLGGLLGLAMLLICQGFVRDCVMGLLLLWDDQYAVGDVIRAAGETGLVEQMNLRLTQVQTAAGGLLFIAHGSLSKIENLSRSWLYAASPNPFNSSDPFNGIDPFSAESTEPTAANQPTANQPAANQPAAKPSGSVNLPLG